MSIGDEAARPHLVSGEQADEPADVRVSAVLEVLAGRPSPEVARRWSVPSALLHRWVRTFVRAGTSAIDDPSPDRSDDAVAQRDRFLAAFAHDVQTPMRVASGWAAMLAEGAVPPQRVPATLDRICEALDTLAERMLDVELLSRAAVGGLALDRQPVTVDDLTVGLPGLAEVGGEGSQIRLPVDPEYFPRVLRDLWRTAHLEPAPERVGLEVRTVAPWIELAVIRIGAPIEPILLRGLFDPFHPTEDDTEVTIGLYLARALAVAHGGTIGAHQDEHHTVLWVRVPRHRSAGDTPTSRRHPAPGAPQMIFELHCGDLLPGCPASFSSTSRERLLEQVAEHAAEAHDLTEISPELRAGIEDQIRTVERDSS